jgi:hypothetical protein
VKKKYAAVFLLAALMVATTSWFLSMLLVPPSTVAMLSNHCGRRAAILVYLHADIPIYFFCAFLGGLLVRSRALSFAALVTVIDTVPRVLMVPELARQVLGFWSHQLLMFPSLMLGAWIAVRIVKAAHWPVPARLKLAMPVCVLLPFLCWGATSVVKRPVPSGDILEFRLAHYYPIDGWEQRTIDNRSVWIKPIADITSKSIQSAEYLGLEPPVSPEEIAMLQRRTPGAVVDTTRSPIVAIRFTPEGRQLFKELTGAHVNEHCAVLSEGRLLAVLRIRNRITDGRAVISGRFKESEAERLVGRLNTRGANKSVDHISGSR